MPNYLRARKGTTYFFTLVTYHRQRILCLERSRKILRQTIYKVKKSYPFAIEAMVLLPDHLHCIWRLPEGDHDYSTRWGMIKSEFTKNTKSWLAVPQPSDSRLKKREGSIWQRRFWEHMIRDDRDFMYHCNYIHYNPVKHGLAAAPKDWPHSTFRWFVKNQIYPLDWGSGTTVTIASDIGRE